MQVLVSNLRSPRAADHSSLIYRSPAGHDLWEAADACREVAAASEDLTEGTEGT